jgi:hypothetical protein
MKVNETKSTHVTFTTRRATAHRLKSMMFNFFNPMKSNISAFTSTDD